MGGCPPHSIRKSEFKAGEESMGGCKGLSVRKSLVSSSLFLSSPLVPQIHINFSSSWTVEKGIWGKAWTTYPLLGTKLDQPRGKGFNPCSWNLLMFTLVINILPCASWLWKLGYVLLVILGCYLSYSGLLCYLGYRGGEDFPHNNQKPERRGWGSTCVCERGRPRRAMHEPRPELLNCPFLLFWGVFFNVLDCWRLVY